MHKFDSGQSLKGWEHFSGAFHEQQKHNCKQNFPFVVSQNSNKVRDDGHYLTVVVDRKPGTLWI